jgi:hypothetical protein
VLNRLPETHQIENDMHIPVPKQKPGVPAFLFMKTAIPRADRVHHPGISLSPVTAA